MQIDLVCRFKKTGAEPKRGDFLRTPNTNQLVEFQGFAPVGFIRLGKGYLRAKPEAFGLEIVMKGKLQ